MWLAKAREDFSELLPKLREIRHDIHQHPELGFEEMRTQALVKEWLLAHGYSPWVSAETGLVTDLFPDRVGKQTTIGLRADMDCLPMQEDTPLPYKSVHPGKAHKCGHDGHTTIMMGVAAILSKYREQIPGNVRLLFQPAEEGVRGGGAKVMVAEGQLNPVEEVYGLHNWPGMPKGMVTVKSGPLMAQVHTFYIELTGVGGHGSQPQLCRDPIVAGAHLVTALQTVVSRGLGYEGGGVLSVGSFHAGKAENVIPGTTKLSGTIRSFHEADTERILERLKEIVSGIEPMFSVKAELKVVTGYPVLINHPGCTEVVQRAAQEVVGAEKVSDLGLPMAGGEDFAYMAREKPGAYFFLGAQKPGENTPVCHHPDFDFDDDLIETGGHIFLGIVADRLR